MYNNRYKRVTMNFPDNEVVKLNYVLWIAPTRREELPTLRRDATSSHNNGGPKTFCKNIALSLYVRKEVLLSEEFDPGSSRICSLNT
jgi:hypothetical protein